MSALAPRAAAAAALVAACAASAQVELRGEPEPLPGEVVSLDGAGVVVEDASSRRVVSWDRIRRVRGELADEAEQYSSVAEELWRARARLERGDWPAAEPLFENISGSAALSGPSAAVAAEGLLRCRLRRGAQSVSVWPWLDWVRATSTAAGGANAPLGGDIDLPPVLDRPTLLAPGLPPMWLASPATTSFADSEAWQSQPEGGVAAELGALYRAAALFEAGRRSAQPDRVSEHPGVVLVREIVQARTADAAARESARELLRARLTLAELPPWQEAWIRAGLGRSLVLESDPELRRAGVLELLHLPARFGADHPYLAGIALAEASVTLHRLGDAGSAGILKRALLSAFPRHPAAGWEPLEEVGQTDGGQSTEQSRAADRSEQG